VLLASEEKAKAVSKKPVWIAGLGLATDTMRIGDRKSLTSILSAREAAKTAYKMAGVGRRILISQRSTTVLPSQRSWLMRTLVSVKKGRVEN